MTPTTIHAICACRFFHQGQCTCPDVTLFVIDDDTPVAAPFCLHEDGARMTFFYCLRGQTRIEAEDIDGNTFSEEIGPEDSLSFCLNGTFSILRKAPLQAVGLQLRSECLTPFACTIVQHCGNLKQATRSLLRGRIPLHLRILLEQIVNCRDSNGPLRDVFLTHKKYELLYQQIELLDKKIRRTSASPAEYKAAQRAYAVLLQDIGKPPRLPELAASVGVNRVRLTELFRMVFGDTVFGILRRERLECARRLLSGNDKTITEIAYLCGFSSPSHLTRAFSAQFGITPKTYQLTRAHTPISG